MEYDGNDYFGFKTEAEFIDWIVIQFDEEADVEVADTSLLKCKLTIIQDGCCEICYTEEVRFDVEYEGAELLFRGHYAYNEHGDLSLSGDRICEG